MERLGGISLLDRAANNVPALPRAPRVCLLDVEAWKTADRNVSIRFTSGFATAEESPAVAGVVSPNDLRALARQLLEFAETVAPSYCRCPSPAVLARSGGTSR